MVSAIKRRRQIAHGDPPVSNPRIAALRWRSIWRSRPQRAQIAWGVLPHTLAESHHERPHRRTQGRHLQRHGPRPHHLRHAGRRGRASRRPSATAPSACSSPPRARWRRRGRPAAAAGAGAGRAHVGTYAAISSHSPREDVVAGANAARAAKADLLVAVGGGSVIDATKAMQLCLWLGLDSAEAMEPYCVGLRAHQILAAHAARRSDPHDRGLHHAVGLRVHRERRHHAVRHQHQAVVQPPPVCAAHRRPRSGRHARYARLAAVLHRHPLRRPCGGELLQRPGQPRHRGALPAGPATAFTRAAGDQEATRAISRPRLEAQIGMWQAIAPSAVGRADRRQPRHRLCAGRHLRRRRTATPRA